MTSLACVLLLAFVVAQSSAGVFNTEPEDQVIKRGSDATVSFSCQADLPEPVYSWRKDDEKLITTNPDKYRKYGGTLDILKPTDADAGKYQCVVSSDDGIVVSNYGELILAYINPFSPSDGKAIETHAGAGVKIPCDGGDYGPNDQVMIYWDRQDHLDRLINGTGAFYVSPTDGALYFSNLLPSDADTYSCTARSKWTGSRGNPVEKKGDAIVLTVGPSDALDRPAFLLPPPATVIGVLGNDVRIECFASGNPTPNIVWTKQGSDMPLNHVVTPSGQLVLKKINKDMVGTYTCQASNSEDSIQESSTLELQYMPQWIEEIASMEVDLTRPLTMRCQATAEPKARYVWLKDGIIISNDTGRFRVSEDGEGSRLDVEATIEEDKGMYQCIAINDHGNLFSNAKVSVVSKPPVFITRVPDKNNAFIGGDVKITCVVDAAPKATIIWKKNNMNLVLDGVKFSMTSDGSLMINNIVEADGGEYRCDADNGIGTVSSSGTLIIYESTVITKGPQNHLILVGGGRELNCEAEHDPQLPLSWVWKQNNQILSLSKHYNILGGTLKLVKVTSRQTGMYECCATTLNQVCAFSSVYVRAPPDPPTNVRITSSTATSQVLEWDVPNANEADISRYIVEENNQYDEMWIPVITDPETVNTPTCRIDSRLPYNQYRYRVAAINSMGTGNFGVPCEFVRTAAANPSVAPKNVTGGGGVPGQLIVTWEPLKPKMYGAEDIFYTISYAKKPKNPSEDESDAEESDQNLRWVERRVDGGNTREKIFQVDKSEINVPYQVKIQAANNVGSGPWTPVAVVYTAELAPTSAPSGFKPAQVQAENAWIQWDELLDPNGITKGYYASVCEVRANCSIESNRRQLKTTNEKPEIEISQLRADSAYEFKAAGFNLGGTGPWSEEFIFDTPGPPPDVAPANVKIHVKDMTLSAKWDAVTKSRIDNPVKDYMVEYWLMNETEHESKYVVTALTHVDFELPAKADYYVWVRARNAGGPGRPSAREAISTQLSTSAEYGGGDFASSLQSSFVLIVSSILFWLLTCVF